ncbi:hypothetical protein F4805DRAFT_434734 [Annulohypoxylon moriforme]|nr:hypothetical protein F4805DRAFT_434734 [Annulohypoxylon moriforme]
MSLPLDQIGSLPPADQQAILDGPALEPPANVVPNFTNPPNSNTLAYVALAICLVASSIAIIVRTYGKFVCVKKGVVEDFLAIAAFGLYIGYIYISYWLLDISGFYVHQWDIRIKDFTTFLYIVYIGTNFYSLTMMIMKASILKEWCRIFVPSGVRNSFFWTCHLIMIINILFYTSIVIAANLSCFPRRRIWDKTVPGSKCLDSKALAVATAAINIILDIATLVLPQRVIWGLRMPMKRKIGVSFIFAIGVLACVSAISRLAYSAQYYISDDTTYTVSSLSLWAIGEMTCMFLIFGGTVAPKVFTSNPWISTLVASVKSWSGFSNASGSSWRPTGTSSQEPKARRVYRQIDEYGIPLTNLSQIGPVTERREEHRDVEGRESGIVCTKQFTAREEYIENSNVGSQERGNRFLWEDPA